MGGICRDKFITLSVGDGVKTIYVEFRDIGGNIAGPVSDTISLQEGSGGEVLGTATFRFATNLELGQEGSAVSELQKRLATEGFFNHEITNCFG